MPTPPITSSPMPPASTGTPVCRVDDGEVPAVERQADAHRLVGCASARRRRRRSSRWGRRCSKPRCTPARAGARASPGRPRRRGSAAGRRQLLAGPQRGERRHGRDDRDALLDEPVAEVGPGADQRARAGTRQAPCRQASHISSQEASKATDRPASTRSRGPERAVLQEQPRLGVDERRGAAVRDRDALRLPGGARGEDDPGVVVRAGQPRPDALRGRGRAASRRAPRRSRRRPPPRRTPCRRARRGRRRRRARRRHRSTASRGSRRTGRRCPTARGCRPGRRGRCRTRRE